MQNKILVTGGTGYIGSHTVVELQNSGFEVVVVDNLSNSDIKVVDRIQKITGERPIFENFDLCDAEKTNNLFKKHRDIKAVIHFAAFKAVGESVSNPLKYYNNNLVSLVNLLNAMQKNKISNLVFSSSCTVYGQPDKLPVTEQSPVKEANSPYGYTKQVSEQIIKDTTIASQIFKAIALRYFNPIGAHDSALIGELPLGVPNNLVPFITQTAIGLRQQLSVFGDDYNTPDGTCIRDYIHVVDLAKSHVIAIERLLKNNNIADFEFFNIGTGKGNSVLEVINTFEKVSGQKLNYKITSRREGDVEKVYADTKFANSELGWKAEKTLDDALLSAWNWEMYYRNNLENKK
ncbi:MAG: UDP-glucose 4-epimerase GalE [Bacteroidetes bacterium]|nr:MAG: UDP-glucose 4-epimerase GalE [Bacteroidota bacterium]